MSAKDLADPQPKYPLRPTYAAGRKRSFPTLRTTFALMLREMSARYGRSPGGYLWALFSPMIMITVLAVAFSLLSRSPPLGSSFLLYYASGQLTLSIYQQIQGAVANALKYSGSLMQFPTVTWIDALLSRFMLNFLTSLIVFFLLLFSIAWFVGDPIRFDMALMLEAVAITGAIGLGFGALTCYLFTEMPGLGEFWAYASRPLFIASGVIFMYEDMPKAAQDILWWNPLMHMTSLVREAIYPRYTADFATPLYPILFALVCGVLGFLLVRQHHDRIMNKAR